MYANTDDSTMPETFSAIAAVAVEVDPNEAVDLGFITHCGQPRTVDD